MLNFKGITSGFIQDRDNDILQDIYDYKPKNREDLSNIIIDNVGKHLEELYEGNRHSWLQEELLEIAQEILENNLDNIVNEYTEFLDNSTY